MPEDSRKQQAGDKAEVTLPGKVEKIIHPISPEEPEKAQINVEGADDLYRKPGSTMLCKTKKVKLSAQRKGQRSR
jgi:hypothetical protein